MSLGCNLLKGLYAFGTLEPASKKMDTVGKQTKFLTILSPLYFPQYLG